MKFVSHYLWEKEGDMVDNSVSVVLQQVEYGKRHILFACVCNSILEGQEGVKESGYFSERMTEWFHMRYLKLFMKEKKTEEALRDMQREGDMILRELEKEHEKKENRQGLNFCVVLLQNTSFFMMQKGNCPILLLNKRYNMSQIKIWDRFDEFGLCQGIIQKNVGILLCTQNYANTIMEMNLKEVLFLERKLQESRLKNRLTEIWQSMKGMKRAGSVGAVYIRTC